jgi:hypothetical protein
MEKIEYKTFTREIFNYLSLESKCDVAKAIGIDGLTFDYALPQDWLNQFVANKKLNYQEVWFSTFMLYPKDMSGIIVSAIEEIDCLLNDPFENDLALIKKVDCVVSDNLISKTVISELPEDVISNNRKNFNRKIEHAFKWHFERTGERFYTVEVVWQDGKPVVSNTI